MKMYPHTDKEWEELPHVFLTSPDRWNPDVLDFKLSDRDDWFNLIKDVKREEYTSPFDVTGEYRKKSSVTTPTRVPDIKMPDSESDEEEEEVEQPMPGLEPQELYDSDSDDDDDDVPPLSMMQHEEYDSSDSESDSGSVPKLTVG